MKLQICIVKLNDTEIIYICVDYIKLAEIEFKIKKCLGDKLKVYFTLKSVNKSFNNKIRFEAKKALLKWFKNFRYHYLKWKKDPKWDNRVVTINIDL